MSAVRAVQSRESMRVGVIGLGVGSLAADAAPKDAVVFYEIDPLVDAFARTRFSFLTKCNPGVQVRLGDARVVMESEARNGYDVLVLDAFSGDSIPMHLLTREAFSLYAGHLAPEGAIAVHISNRYLDLMPVVKAAGEREGFTVRFIRSSGDANKGYFEALWAVLVRDQKLLAHESLAKAIADSPQTDRTLLWTDDFSNLLSAIR
jgi:spermidine synthase